MKKRLKEIENPARPTHRLMFPRVARLADVHLKLAEAPRQYSRCFQCLVLAAAAGIFGLRHSSTLSILALTLRRLSDDDCGLPPEKWSSLTANSLLQRGPLFRGRPIGVSRDALAGPVVTVGMGGVLAEIYRDMSVRPAPVSVETARLILAEIKGLAILRGYRGKPVGDLEALAHAVSRVSTLALCDAVAEAEINPVLVRGQGDGVFMLDALIVKA